MTDEHRDNSGVLSPGLPAVLVLLAGGLTFATLVGFTSNCLPAALITVVTEGGVAALIVIAAGGYAFPLVRRLSPSSAPTGLRVVTSCAFGLWMFSAAMLASGSAGGLLRGRLWWPIVGVGVVLAAWHGRKKLEAWRPARRCSGRVMIWVLVALAAGMWLAGAARAPGFIGSADAYDILEYHLQAPREFYNAGRVGRLTHNCYSYYPLGVEMLFLLGMCLRGGAYEGMYLAKMLHGAFGVLAVAGVFFALKRDDEVRGRFAAGLLATVPILLYLSWLAMVELAVVCYTALAMLWLREWLRAPDRRAAVCVGVMLGASCAVKYLSVGFVVAPVLVVMIISSLRSRRRLCHLPLVGFATLFLFAPWLIRNTVYTGNPVFPLATSVFGRGHWSDESDKRWVDGHAPDKRPPVPGPAGWKMPPQPGRVENFLNNFLGSRWFGPALLILAAAAVAAMIARGNRTDPWDVALLATAAMQLGVWAAFTRGMPPRFIVPVVAPVVLLAAGALAKLAGARARWKTTIAVALFAAVAGMGLAEGYSIFRANTASRDDPPWPGRRIAAEGFPYHHAAELPDGSKILLVGEAKAFYFPPNTVYATCFDTHPLAELIDRGLGPREIHRELRSRGITHIWGNFSEVIRLAMTYGYPRSLSEDVLSRAGSGRRPGMKLLDDLAALNLITEVKNVHLPSQPARRGDSWPMAAIYTLAAGISHPATSEPARN